MIKERLTLFLLGVLLGLFISANIIAEDHISVTILVLFVMIIAGVIIMIGEK